MFDSIQKRGFGGNRDNSIMRNGLQVGPAKNFSATTETVELFFCALWRARSGWRNQYCD